MIFHENRLPADDSHEIYIMPYLLLFEKAAKLEIVVCCKLQVELYGLKHRMRGIYVSAL